MPVSSRPSKLLSLIVLPGFLGVLAIALLANVPRADLLLSGLAAMIVLFISFLHLPWGLALIAVAMLLGPELTPGESAAPAAPVSAEETGDMGPPAQPGGMEAGKSVALRLDDFLIVAVALGWFFKSVFQGRRWAIAWTPINHAVWIYMTASIVATIFGVIRENVTVRSGFFFNLKYFEYFLLYYMVIGIVKTKEQLTNLLRIMMLVFVVVSLYGLWQVPSGERVFAPFDTEPNTLSGYFIVMGAVAVAMGAAAEALLPKLFYFGSAVLCFLPFLHTQSRAGYLALVVCYVAFMVFAQYRGRLVFTGLAIACLMGVGWLRLPQSVIDRVLYTFSGEKQEDVAATSFGAVELDPSASARVNSYKYALSKWRESPILGRGVTGTTFIDGQYVRLLAETGIVGLGAFLYLLYRVFRSLKVLYDRVPPQSEYRGLILGLLCGFLGLCAHALTANSFIIIRIAEPFWVLLGISLLIPRIDGWQDLYEDGFRHPALRRRL